MRRVKNRVLSMLILVAIIIGGMGFYIVKMFVNGDKWVAIAANKSVYTDGVLSVGTLYDRNGVILAGIDEENNRTYAEDSTVRKATLHVVGDIYGNIGTGALKIFASELTGYNIIDGTYSLSGDGGSVYLTIDSELNKVAYEALGGKKGTVAVFNYKTGEILTMVSTPTYDQANPPAIADGDSQYDGVYLNRALSSAFTPGSVYKLVTLAAAIENIPDLYDRTFTCTGSYAVGGDSIKCTGTHGDIKIEDALAVSCNCAFAQIALELGGETIAKYAKTYGLTTSQTIDGVSTAAGKFEVAEDDTANLAWSGIGQYTNLVNPAAMLRFVGAIANEGVAVQPTMLYNVKSSLGISTGFYPKKSTERIMSAATANAIAKMMNYNVAKTYGKDNFPGLELYAKSGTAEVGGGASPHSWFVGYIANEDYPLAFVVVVENGGSGQSVAGAIANKVLQAAIAAE